MTYEYEEAGVYIAFTCPDLNNMFWVAMVDYCHLHISHALVSPLGVSHYALGVPNNTKIPSGFVLYLCIKV